MAGRNCIKVEYLGDEVYLILNESYRHKPPPGAIVYTLSEAHILINRSAAVKKTVHELKKLAGARVSPVTVTSQKRHKNVIET